MKNKGWVKLWRDQFNNWVSKKPFCDGYAWSYLYGQANHKEGMVNFRNEYIEVERGQHLTSKLKLQEIFGWTYRHVDSFLRALENDKNITYRTTNRYILITIVNYNKYQGGGEQNGEQVKNRRRTDIERGNTNKNDKNVKNVKKEDTLSSKCALIIDYLNEKTVRKKKGKRCFDPKNKSTMDFIRARFNEGRTVKDFIDVIDKKVKDWLTDDKMYKWLRPSTLFGRTNFENYINEPEPDKYAKYLKKE